MLAQASTSCFVRRFPPLQFWSENGRAFPAAHHVVFWPAMLAGLLVIQGGNWFAYFLLLALVVAYSAAIASLGLAMATWVSRLGRAVAICVTVCVVFSVGWMFLIMALFRPDRMGIPLIMGSPLYGMAAATSLVAGGSNPVVGGHWRAAAGGAVMWTLIHLSTAAMLFLVTLATFENCLGRVAAYSRSDRRPKAKKVFERRRAEPDEWLDDDPLALAESPQS